MAPASTKYEWALLILVFSVVRTSLNLLAPLVTMDCSPKLVATLPNAWSSSFLMHLCRAISASMVGRSLGMTTAVAVPGTIRDSTRQAAPNFFFQCSIAFSSFS